MQWTGTRRAVVGGLAASTMSMLAPWQQPGATARAAVASAQATPVTPPTADAVIAIVEELMAELHLKAAIVRVTIDGEEFVTLARGDSMNGVPATPEMHFRNGAIAITYVSTALLILVDRGEVSLDDSLANWLPDLPEAEQATLRMLANMTAGYTDYVNTSAFTAANYANPFRAWTPEEIIAIGLDAGRFFAPGENWAYSHTDYVILGLALEKITGQPLDQVLRDLVLDPLGLTNTANHSTPEIPVPVLHAYTSERKSSLQIPAKVRFYEESTFWDPSWSIAHGAIQTTNIFDLATTASGIGEGVLLSSASYQEQTAKTLAGFGSPVEGCATCMTLSANAPYGLGIWLPGNWLVQNPLFGGYGAFMAYHPAQKLAIAAAVTFTEDAFDAEGNYLTFNPSQNVGKAIATLLAPEHPLG